MRGVFGSGKSTLAKKLAFDQEAICSADDFFVGKDGTYRWDPMQLESAHAACRAKLLDQAMRGITPLVVDNTNLRQSDVDSYAAFGRGFGYEIALVELKPPSDPEALASYVDACYARCIHDVPRDKIERMAKKLLIG